MCLAIPAEIIELLEDEQAVVKQGGVSKMISIALLESVAVGDYVIVHTGYALSVIDEVEAQKTLTLFAEMGYDIGQGGA